MILDLVPCDDPILLNPVPKFDFVNPPTDPIQLAKDLAETMIFNNGLGLSANQVGLPYRAFVINAEKIIACFNPIIVDRSTETVYLEEGCLSFPNLFVKVKRPKKIKVRYTEPNGNVETRVFDGMTSRIFQHELSHLEGVTFKQEANRFHLEQAIRKAKSIKKRLK